MCLPSNSLPHDSLTTSSEIRNSCTGKRRTLSFVLMEANLLARLRKRCAKQCSRNSVSNDI